MPTEDRRAQRKLDHLRYFRQDNSKRSSGLEDVHFIHQALPEINLEEISLSCRWLGKTLAAPFIINALTGGPPETVAINASLARVARRTGIAMAVGSQKAALDDPAMRPSFTVVREENPGGLILANIGCGARPEEAAEAVEMISADGLQLHLNTPQELFMQEGERLFREWRHNLASVCRALRVPVIAKEVGFGLARETALALFLSGVRLLDVGGAGGTNFLAIEGRRAGQKNGVLEWGIPTAVSLVEVVSLNLPVQVIATGGIRSPLDAAKALALGADLVGIAGYFLEVLVDAGEEALVAEIESWKETLRYICLMVGAKAPEELRRKPLIITGRTREWLLARGVDVERFGRR
ncbi:MAG: isopentenyl-diphosphate Delta-isomerase [Clostridia bacterium]|nr:isopentenyl-diphosphate Delta-isomerase [Clostridia bacterium]